MLYATHRLVLEFVHSGRLDNLASCFLAVQALIECVDGEDFLSEDKDVSMVVLYDHEEVGSSSTYDRVEYFRPDASSSD